MSEFTKLHSQEFHHLLEQQPGLVLVFFSHDMCGSCRHWQQLLSAYRKQRPDIAIYTVDAQEEMALTQEFEVFHLPALFLYQDGHFHAPLQCAASVDALDTAVTQLLAQPAREMP